MVVFKIMKIKGLTNIINQALNKNTIDYYCLIKVPLISSVEVTPGRVVVF